jgi:hypothetical protein
MLDGEAAADADEVGVLRRERPAGRREYPLDFDVGVPDRELAGVLRAVR